MNEFEKSLENYIGKERLDNISLMKIGIAGCGGIGSNVAVNLVRSGFKKFKLVDFDLIEHSNLNRQFYFSSQVGQKKVSVLKDNLVKINLDLDIECADLKIDIDNVIGMFDDCDLIVEAFDNPACKAMLVSKLINSGKLIVGCSGVAGIGKSCDIKINKIKDNLIIVGDMVSEVKNSFPLSPRVNVTAAIMADYILECAVDK